MQVTATENGFYGGARIRAGTTFEVPDGSKAKWYVPVEAPAARKARAQANASAKPDKPQTLAGQSKAKAQTFTDAMKGDKGNDGGAGDLA